MRPSVSVARAPSLVTFTDWTVPAEVPSLDMIVYGAAPMLTGANGAFFGLGTVIAIAGGVAALWRPAFTLPLLFHYVAFRHQLNRVSGVEISETDYLSMLDVGEFAAIGALFTVFLTGRRGRNLLPAWVDLAELKASAAMLVFIWAVGAHLGNYFISGWTKIQASGDQPLFWMLHARGYEIGSLHKRETETEKLLRVEREARAKAEEKCRLLMEAIAGRAVA